MTVLLIVACNHFSIPCSNESEEEICEMISNHFLAEDVVALIRTTSSLICPFETALEAIFEEENNKSVYWSSLYVLENFQLESLYHGGR